MMLHRRKTCSSLLRRFLLARPRLTWPPFERPTFLLTLLLLLRFAPFCFLLLCDLDIELTRSNCFSTPRGSWRQPEHLNLPIRKVFSDCRFRVQAPCLYFQAGKRCWRGLLKRALH